MMSKSHWKQHRRFRMAHRSIHTNHSPLHQLPDYVDLRHNMLRVVNQRDMNTCTAATFASACEYLIKRHTGRDIPISQLFIFFNGRVMDHGRHFFDDGGVSRRHVVKGMRRFGICKEEIWPMKRHYLNKKPPVNVYTQAKRTTVSAHHIPLDITAIRTSLAQKIPAIIGIKIEDGVFNEASVNGGYLSIPDPENMEIVYTGTHAVLVVGYDDTSQQFIVRNSWGSHWGDQGYFYMPYDYLLDERLVNYTDGAWVVTGIARKPKHHHHP